RGAVSDRLYFRQAFRTTLGRGSFSAVADDDPLELRDKLSKDSLILGLLQIEATIDQDTTISRQLTLWDQHGLRMIRGMFVPSAIRKTGSMGVEDLERSFHEFDPR